MKIDDVFPSKYLKTGDLQGRRVKVTMAFVQVEKVGDDQKPVVFFAGKEKGLILNVTKWNSIADIYGEESDDWTGKAIVLAPGKTTYQGKRVDCIDIYAPPPPSAGEVSHEAQRPPAPAPERQLEKELNDEIPF